MKNNLFRRVTALFLFFVLMLSLALPAYAESAAPDLSRADAVLLYNVEDARILCSKNEEKIIYPASTVKMMTGLLATETLGERLDASVTITKEMLAGVSGKNISLEAGEVVTVRDLLFAAFCGGNNDASLALAHLCAGSVEAFVARMNERAALLGMSHTFFTNPTGMHDGRMVTTAADLLLLSRAALENKLFITITSTQKYAMAATSRHSARMIHNRNQLVSSTVSAEYYYSPAVGLNAGSTTEGGDCLITSAASGGLSYICIVMGVSPATESDPTVYSYLLAKELLSYAIKQFHRVTLLEAGTIVDSLPVRVADRGKAVDVSVADDLTLLLNRDIDPQNDVVFSIRRSKEELEAPVAPGEQVGYLTVSLEDEILGTVPLVTASAVSRSSFLSVLEFIKAFTSGRVFRISMLCFVLFLALYFFFVSRRNKRRNYNRNKYF